MIGGQVGAPKPCPTKPVTDPASKVSPVSATSPNGHCHKSVPLGYHWSPWVLSSQHLLHILMVSFHALR